MDKNKNTPKAKELATPSQQPSSIDPNVLVFNFLKENNLHMKITAIDNANNGFNGNGFIIEDRPILQVVFERL